VLIQALKDANWRVRVTAAKSLANPESASALDILMYKARKDPVAAVRIEAVKALGEIGKKEGFDLLRELYVDERQSLDVRTSCLDVLVEKDLGNSTESLWKVVEEHIGKPMFQSKILDYTAKKLSETEGMAAKGVLQRLLDAESPLVRISGIRGIALNRYSSLRQRLEKIAAEDPHPGVRKEAASALEKW
jgi:HEAT repeat protein